MPESPCEVRNEDTQNRASREGSLCGLINVLWTHQRARVPIRGENRGHPEPRFQRRLSVGGTDGPTSLNTESGTELQGHPTSLIFVLPAWPLARLGFVTLESFLGAGHNKHPGAGPQFFSSPISQQHPQHLTIQPPRAMCWSLNASILCLEGTSPSSRLLLRHHLCLVNPYSSSQVEAQLKCPFWWEAPPGLRGGTGPSFFCATSLHMNTFHMLLIICSPAFH